jgi:hypothetical protein
VPAGCSAEEANGSSPGDGMRLRSTVAATQPAGGGGGGCCGVGVGAFSRCVILAAVSVVWVSNEPSEVSVVARQASNSVILSSICCIMSVRLSTLLAILACNDGGRFFGARPNSTPRQSERKNFRRG